MRSTVNHCRLPVDIVVTIRVTVVSLRSAVDCFLKNGKSPHLKPFTFLLLPTAKCRSGMFFTHGPTYVRNPGNRIRDANWYNRQDPRPLEYQHDPSLCQNIRGEYQPGDAKNREDPNGLTQTNDRTARNHFSFLRPLVYGRTVYLWLNSTSVPRSVSRKWVRRFLRFRTAQRQLSGFLKLFIAWRSLRNLLRLNLFAILIKETNNTPNWLWFNNVLWYNFSSKKPRPIFRLNTSPVCNEIYLQISTRINMGYFSKVYFK